MAWLPELEDQQTRPEVKVPERRGAGEHLDKWVAARIVALNDPDLYEIVKDDPTVSAEDMWRFARGGFSQDPSAVRRNALLGEHTYTAIPAGYGGTVAGQLLGKGIGGLVGRGLAGAAAGGALGSVAPGIGNVVGAGLGFLGGAFLGRELANYLNPSLAGSSLLYEALGLGIPGSLAKRAFPAIKAGEKAARLTRIPGVGKVASKVAEQMPSFGAPFRAVSKVSGQYKAARAAKELEKEGWEKLQIKLLESEAKATAAAQEAGRIKPRGPLPVLATSPTAPRGVPMPTRIQPGPLPTPPKLLPPGGTIPMRMGPPQLTPQDVELLLRQNITPTPSITEKGIARTREMIYSPKARELAFKELLAPEIPPTTKQITQLSIEFPPPAPPKRVNAPKPGRKPRTRTSKLYRRYIQGKGYSSETKYNVRKAIEHPLIQEPLIPSTQRTPVQAQAIARSSGGGYGRLPRELARGKAGTSRLSKEFNILYTETPSERGSAAMSWQDPTTGKMVPVTLMHKGEIRKHLPHELGHHAYRLTNITHQVLREMAQLLPPKPGLTASHSIYLQGPEEAAANVIAKAIRRGENDASLDKFSPQLQQILRDFVKQARSLVDSGQARFLPVILAGTFGADISRSIMKELEKNVAPASAGTRSRK